MSVQPRAAAAAIIAPSVEPFPVEAILRETPLNEEGIVIADLDFDQLLEARSKGDVRNYEDRNSGTWTVQKIGHAIRPEPSSNDFDGLA